MIDTRSIPDFKDKKILVTGGAGMIGSHLVARLLREGSKVTVIDDLSSGKKDFLPLDNPNLKLVEGSINDSEKLNEAFSDNPEIVFHLAARFANQNSVDHPEEDLIVNGLGTLQVLEKARQANVERVVYSSSSCVYPTHLQHIDEEAQDSSYSTPYAITKFIGERYCKYFNSHYGLPVTIIRYFNCYGPHEVPGEYRNVIPNFIKKALNNEPLTVHGDGAATRDYTYVEDAIECTCLAGIKKEAIGKTFNIGTGTEVTVNELANKINHLTQNTAGIERIPIRTWDKVLKRSANSDKARRMLGFMPVWRMDEGIQKTIEWLKEHQK